MHQRPQRIQEPVSRPVVRRQSQPSVNSSTMSAFDAKLRLIAQRIKIMENNVQVMSRTLVSHNKKIKDLETTVAAGGGGKVDVDAIKKALREEFDEKLSAQQSMAPLEINDYNAGSRKTVAPEAVKEVKKELAELRKQVSEMEYVLESVNPMEYVTLEDINDVIDRKIAALKD